MNAGMNAVRNIARRAGYIPLMRKRILAYQVTHTGLKLIAPERSNALDLSSENSTNQGWERIVF
mgnify:CR=1 FL=1